MVIMKTQTNCYIDVELKKIALENNLNFSEILEFGLKFKLAEMDALDEKGNCYLYPKNKLMEKIEKLQEVILSQTEQ